MFGDFDRLNAGDQFAVTFCRQPNSVSTISVDRAGLYRRCPSDGYGPGAKPCAANHRFTLIEQNGPNAIRVGRTADIAVAPTCPAAPPASQAISVHPLETSTLGAASRLQRVQPTPALPKRECGQ